MVVYGKAQSAINSGMHPKRDFDVVKQPGTKGYAEDGMGACTQSGGVADTPVLPHQKWNRWATETQRPEGERQRHWQAGTQTIGKRQKTKDKKTKKKDKRQKTDGQKTGPDRPYRRQSSCQTSPSGIELG